MKCFVLSALAVLLFPSLQNAIAAPLLPDLTPDPTLANAHVVYRTYAPDDCTVREGCAIAGTRRLLVFTTVTRNIGTADLVVGDPATNSIFYYDPCHNHYHYTGFAEYRLRRSDGGLAVVGRKIGFCLEDIMPWDPNAPNSRRYDCNYQGIQKGWADVYSENTPCNWIDIAGLPGGNYFLELEINPTHNLAELDYSNNMASIPVSFGDDCGATPANDSFANADPIPKSPFSVRTYNACGTREPGEPEHAGNAGGHSVWWQATAVANSVITLSTLGSDFDTLLAVYTGSSVGSLSLVASNDDVSATVKSSFLSFDAVAGTDYHIAVDGWDGAFGTVVLNVNPPVNDTFTDCIVLNGTHGTMSGHNVGATKEPNEPDHAGNIGGHSVWFCWTSPVNQAVEVDTVGSDFDSTLGVYIGDTVDNLTLVATDNDSGGNFTSRLGFKAGAGATYHIAVDGVSGASGSITLNWGLFPGLTVQKKTASGATLVLGPGQGTYEIDASDDLEHWNKLATLTTGATAQQYLDNAAGALAHRFYRAILAHN